MSNTINQVGTGNVASLGDMTGNQIQQHFEHGVLNEAGLAQLQADLAELRGLLAQRVRDGAAQEDVAALAQVDEACSDAKGGSAGKALAKLKAIGPYLATLGTAVSARVLAAWVKLQVGLDP